MTKAMAYHLMVDGIYYNVNFEDMTAEVTYGDVKYSGDVVIPEFVVFEGRTLPVVSVGAWAFGACDSLTSVSMPNVTSIKSYAFRLCRNLISVSMPNVTSINYDAFAYCNSLTSVSMPNVTNIDSWVFGECSGLTSVDMPNVTYIGLAAFRLCSSLTSVSMPNVSYIGSDAFADCGSLTSVSIPGVTTVVSDGALNGVEELYVADGEPNSILKLYYSSFYWWKIKKLYLGRVCKLESSVSLDCCESAEFGENADLDASVSFDNSLKTLTLHNSPEYYENAQMEFSFIESNYSSAALYVPDEYLEEYKTTEPWSNFVNIYGIRSTGIVRPSVLEDVQVERIYDADGRELDRMERGLNILKMSDGTTRKVVRK